MADNKYPLLYDDPVGEWLRKNWNAIFNPPPKQPAPQVAPQVAPQFANPSWSGVWPSEATYFEPIGPAQGGGRLYTEGTSGGKKKGWVNETRGGKVLAVFYDNDGIARESVVISDAEQTGLSPWQQEDTRRWELERSAQDYAQRQQSAEMNLQNRLIQEGNAWQREQMQLAQRGGGLGGYGQDYREEAQYYQAQMKEMERAQQAKDFETMRQNMISEWEDSPRDWVKLYKAKIATNPFGSTTVDKTIGSPEDTGPSGPDPEGHYRTTWEEATDGPTSGSMQPMYEWIPTKKPVVPKTPEIPDWLAQMTGMYGRVPEERGDILTPSPQGWAATPWSQREMWGGLVGAAGKRPEMDILEQMQIMLPQNPTLGSRNAPFRQRR